MSPFDYLNRRELTTLFLYFLDTSISNSPPTNLRQRETETVGLYLYWYIQIAINGVTIINRLK